MPKIRDLTDDEAQDRLDWLMHKGPREFWHLVDHEGNLLQIDDAGVDKLYEISKVARQVAKHFKDKNSLDRVIEESERG